MDFNGEIDFCKIRGAKGSELSVEIPFMYSVQWKTTLALAEPDRNRILWHFGWTRMERNPTGVRLATLIPILPECETDHWQFLGRSRANPFLLRGLDLA